jgi:hypothetical protein
MDLENLVSKVSSLLSEGSTIVFHSDQTQTLVGACDTILWNDDPTHISEDVYNEFKDKLRNHTAKFYTMTNVLPYVDFCIALLCSSSYSLNHNTTASVQPRVFTAAWRSIDVVSKMNTGEMAAWLQRYIKGRTAKGYTNTFDLDMDAGTIPLRTHVVGKPSKRFNLKDRIEEITLQAAASKDIVDIKHHGEDQLLTPKVFWSTSMPDGQLSDLRIVHEIMTKKR